MSSSTVQRWSFLNRFPKRLRPQLDAIAQESLDSYRERAFPTSIHYPIVDTQGNAHGTLTTFRSSAYWTYLNAKLVYEHGNSCDVCEGTTELHGFHLSYGHIGREERHREELLVLCDHCAEYLQQQQRTGRRYGWRVQPLENWLYTSKQERQRRAAKLRIESLHDESEPTATTVEELVESLSAVSTETRVSTPPRNSTPPARRFPVDEPAARHPERITIEISGEVSFPTEEAPVGPHDMVVELDGETYILRDARCQR